MLRRAQVIFKRRLAVIAVEIGAATLDHTKQTRTTFRIKLKPGRFLLDVIAPKTLHAKPCPCCGIGFVLVPDREEFLIRAIATFADDRTSNLQCP